MRVKFNTTISDGEGRKFASGSVAEVADAEAKVWLGHGLVESVEVEKRDATNRAPRTAAKRSGKRKG